MRLLIDGDSCPADRRKIITTAANRLRAHAGAGHAGASGAAVAGADGAAEHAGADNSAVASADAETLLFFVNSEIRLDIAGASMIRSANADRALLQYCRAHDTVITRDLLLAAQLLDKHSDVEVLDYCGRSLNADSIRSRLSYRGAVLSGGVQNPRGNRGDLAKCKKQFADSLDRIITRALRQRGRAAN